MSSKWSFNKITNPYILIISVKRRANLRMTFTPKKKKPENGLAHEDTVVEFKTARVA